MLGCSIELFTAFWCVCLDGIFPHIPWRHASISIRNSPACIPKYSQLSVARGPYHCLPPVANGSGQYHYFVGLAAGTCMYDRKKKKRRTDNEAERGREKNSIPNGKSCLKTNSCTKKWPWPTKLSKEGLRRPVWSSAGSRSLAVFEQLRVEFVGDGTNHSVKAICICFRNTAFPTGSSRRHQATSSSNRWRSTAGELRAPLLKFTLLDDAHFPDPPRTPKKNLPSFSQTKGRSWEIESNLFVCQAWCAPDDPCNIQISKQCKLQGHVGTTIQALGFGLDRSNPDRCALRRGLDAARSSRILLMDCLITELFSSFIVLVRTSDDYWHWYLLFIFTQRRPCSCRTASGLAISLTRTNALHFPAINRCASCFPWISVVSLQRPKLSFKLLGTAVLTGVLFPWAPHVQVAWQSNVSIGLWEMIMCPATQTWSVIMHGWLRKSPSMVSCSFPVRRRSFGVRFMLAAQATCSTCKIRHCWS